jgi:hypothetical protein
MSSQRIATRSWKRLPVGAKAVAAAAPALIVIAGAANATIPGDDGSISGCYVKTTGALRVVDTEASAPPKCRSTEIALAWNQTGVQGETGEQGPAGPAGEQGPAGEPGASGAEVYFMRGSEAILGGHKEVKSMNLPAGSYVAEKLVHMIPADDQDADFKDMGCTLQGPASSYIDIYARLRKNEPSAEYHGSGAFVHPGGKVTILCGWSSAGRVDVFATVLLTKVASVNGSSSSG